MNDGHLTMEALAELDAIARTTNAIGGPTMLSASLWRSSPIYARMVQRKLIRWKREQPGSAMRVVSVLPAGHDLLAAAEKTGILARARAEAEAREAEEVDHG